jgi:hypothetical protein
MTQASLPEDNICHSFFIFIYFILACNRKVMADATNYCTMLGPWAFPSDSTGVCPQSGLLVLGCSPLPVLSRRSSSCVVWSVSPVCSEASSPGSPPFPPPFPAQFLFSPPVYPPNCKRNRTRRRNKTSPTQINEDMKGNMAHRPKAQPINQYQSEGESIENKTKQNKIVDAIRMFSPLCSSRPRLLSCPFSPPPSTALFPPFPLSPRPPSISLPCATPLHLPLVSISCSPPLSPYLLPSLFTPLFPSSFPFCFFFFFF